MAAPRCRQLDDTRLVIASSPGWVATLFGLPFLGVGLYLLYQFLGAAYAYFSTVAFREFGTALLGFAVILMMAAAFGVPGALLVLFRKRVLIDAARREVCDVKDFYFFRRSHRRDLADFSRVALELRDYGSSSDGDSAAGYCWFVELKGQGDPVLVGMCDAEEEAQALGNTVAQWAGLPLRRV